MKKSLIAIVMAMFGSANIVPINNQYEPSPRRVGIDFAKYRDKSLGTMSRRVARNLAMGRFRYSY